MRYRLAKKYQFQLGLLLSLFMGLGILYQWGEGLESKTRNFYRQHLCHCDTLRKQMVYDQNGIPWMNYYSTSGEPIGLQYNPFELMKVANAKIEADNHNEALSLLQYCIKESSRKDSAIFFTYQYSWLPYNIHPGWNSALTQGYFLGLCEKMHQKDKNPYWKAVGDSVLNSFALPFREGGFVYQNQIGYWYEEYGQLGSKNPHVLNGHLHALKGLISYHRHFPSPKTQWLIDSGLSSLRHHIYLYDNPFGGTYYDRLGLVASKDYHALHIELLKQILSYKTDPLLSLHLVKWEKYAFPNWIIKSIKNPNKTVVLLGLGMWFFLFCTFMLVRTIMLLQNKRSLGR